MSEISLKLNEIIGFHGTYLRRSMSKGTKRVSILIGNLIDLKGNEIRDHNWFDDITNMTNQKIKHGERFLIFAKVISYQKNRIKLDYGIIFKKIDSKKEKKQHEKNKKLTQHKSSFSSRKTSSIPFKVKKEKKPVLKNQGKKQYLKRQKPTKNFESTAKLKEYQQEKILFQNQNINTASNRILLLKLAKDYISEKHFLDTLVKHKYLQSRDLDDFNPIFENLLFTFVKVSGRLFMGNFEGYCRLIRIFSQWNSLFTKEFSDSAPYMFKNMMIPYGPSGKNFPITSTNQLKKYLNIFNTIENIDSIPPENIMIAISAEYSRKKLSKSKYEELIKLIKPLISNKRILRMQHIV
jgi:hypothetical protein